MSLYGFPFSPLVWVTNPARSGCHPTVSRGRGRSPRVRRGGSPHAPPPRHTCDSNAPRCAPTESLPGRPSVSKAATIWAHHIHAHGGQLVCVGERQRPNMPAAFLIGLRYPHATVQPSSRCSLASSRVSATSSLRRKGPGKPEQQDCAAAAFEHLVGPTLAVGPRFLDDCEDIGARERGGGRMRRQRSGSQRRGEVRQGALRRSRGYRELLLVCGFRPSVHEEGLYRTAPTPPSAPENALTSGFRGIGA